MVKLFLSTVVIALVIAAPSAAKKPKQPTPPPECPVDTVIRTANPALLKRFTALAGCADQIIVAPADIDEFANEDDDSSDIESASNNSTWGSQYAINGDDKTARNGAELASTRSAVQADFRSNPSVVNASANEIAEGKASNKNYSVTYLHKGKTRRSYAGTGAVIRIAGQEAQQDQVDPAYAAAPSFSNTVAVQGQSAVGASPQASAILAMRPQSYTTQFDALISETATRHRVDPLFLHAVIKQESGYKAQVVSHAGARGLMQIMPATGRSLGVDPSNLTSAAHNVDAGARLLRKLYYRYNGNFDLVLAAYNAGEGAVQKYGNQIPPYKETQNYVRSVMSIYYKLLAEQNGVGTAK